MLLGYFAKRVVLCIITVDVMESLTAKS